MLTPSELAEDLALALSLLERLDAHENSLSAAALREEDGLLGTANLPGNPARILAKFRARDERAVFATAIS